MRPNASVLFKIRNNKVLKKLKNNAYAQEKRVCNLKTIVRLLDSISDHDNMCVMPNCSKPIHSNTAVCKKHYYGEE